MKPRISLYQPLGGAFALVAAALFVVALIVLGQAIGWPGILREPDSVVLPRIEAHRTAMLLGYAAYLLSSLALIPVAFALRDRLVQAGCDATASTAVAFFGGAGAILKTLGIVRWLSVMPLLSKQYAAATSDEVRSAIELSYLTINGYAGAVGELLGVQLVSGIWIAGSAALMIRGGAKWVGSLGLVTGVGFLLTTVRVFDPAFAALQAFANPLGLLWFIVLGIVMLRGRKPLA